MNLTDTPTVFIVDDDASVRDGMAWLLRTRRLLSVPFKSAESFLDMLNAHIPPAQDPTTPSPLPSVAACILLDVRMPGMSGLALFEHLLLTGVAHAWPVIFLTGHADVPTAVDTVKRGAFDFCEKPFSDNTLVDRVEQALSPREKDDHEADDDPRKGQRQRQHDRVGLHLLERGQRCRLGQQALLFRHHRRWGWSVLPVNWRACSWLTWAPRTRPELFDQDSGCGSGPAWVASMAAR